MKRLLTISATLLNLASANAQTNVYHPFPEESAFWNFEFVKYCVTSAETYGSYSINISGDTVINNKTYQKLITPHVKFVGNCGSHPAGYKGAIRQDIALRKVYIVPPSDSVEELLYDFNLEVGDSVKGYLVSDLIQLTETVISIDSVLVGSNYRKRWYINDCYEIYLIEGIGSTYGLIEGTPGCIADWAFFRLTCFSQNEQVLFPDTTANCELITSAPFMDNYADKVNIFPNPFSKETTIMTGIPVNKAALIIGNSLGQIVRQIENVNGQRIPIDRGNLSAGVYYLRLMQENNVIAIERLVVTD